MEDELDEAIGSSRSRHGSASFDSSGVTELRVKQKYMGHRNARYTYFSITYLFYFLVARGNLHVDPTINVIPASYVPWDRWRSCVRLSRGCTCTSLVTKRY